MTDSDLSPLATPPSLAPLKKAQGARKLVLFLCVGATGVIVNLAVGIATQMAMPNSPVVGRNLGVLLGWTFAVLSNFLLNNSITFGGQAHHKNWSQRLLSYYLSSIVSLLVQFVFYHLGRRFFPPFSPAFFVPFVDKFAYVFGIGVGTIANFVLASKVVFRAHEAPKSAL
jgi:putative flippase GtrA